MRTPPRRSSTFPLPAHVALALLAAAPGCQKVQEVLGQAEQAVKGQTEEASTGEAQAEEVVVEQTREEAVADELPSAAVVEAAPATPLTELAGLLELLPAEKVAPDGKLAMLAIARDASVLFDYAEAAEKLAGPGLKRMADASADNAQMGGDLKEAQAAYEMGRGQIDAALAAFKTSGIEFSKGAMMWQVAGESYLVYAGSSPDALKSIGKAFGQDMGSSVCKAVDGHAGYHVCADAQASLDAYKPGGAEGATALRASMEKSLAGVDLEKANLLGFAEKGWIAVATPPGLMVLSIALPTDDNDVADFKKMFRPAPPKTLRGVQPGAGFVWANLDLPTLTEKESDLKSAPPPVQDAMKQLTGEILLAGHYAPPAISLQFGIKDAAAFGPVMDMAKDAEKEVPKTLEQVPGSEVKFELIDLPVGATTAKAIHVGVSKVPEADVLATYTGLTLDGWAFPANDTFTVAIGASAEAIGHVADEPGEGPSDKLKAYLPPALIGAAERGEVSFIMHIPLDALHGPETRKLVDAALKNAKQVKPDLVYAFVSLAAPLSSGTAWTTHAGDGLQVHLAMQGIGHTADDEGKAALDAAAKAVAGEDASSLFAALAEKYPDSSRSASYKARAGQTEAALVASGIGAALATAVLTLPMASGERNDGLAKELGVEEGAAEKAVEDSKADPEEKKQTVKKKKKKKVEDKKSEEKKEEEKVDDGKKVEPLPIPPKPDDEGGDDGAAEGGAEGGEKKPERLKRKKLVVPP